MEKKGVKIGISVISLAFSVLVLIISIFFSGPFQESEIETIYGIFDNYYEKTHATSRSTETTRSISLKDGSNYIIDSITHRAFDKDSFLTNVKNGDQIKMIVEKSTNKVGSAALGINKDEVEYMNYETVQKARHTNQRIGLIFGVIITLVSLILLYIALK